MTTEPWPKSKNGCVRHPDAAARDNAVQYNARGLTDAFAVRAEIAGRLAEVEAEHDEILRKRDGLTTQHKNA